MFGFLKRKAQEIVVKMLLPEVEDILAMAINELVRIWNSSQESVAKAIGGALQRTPMKDTATHKEINTMIDAFEDWMEASAETKEFKAFKKAVFALFKA